MKKALFVLGGAALTFMLMVVIGIFKPVNATYKPQPLPNCVFGCESVTWTHKICTDWHRGRCRDWEDGKTFTVAYTKSEDQNHCHRPSDSSLKNDYGMTNDERNAFKDDNNEWKNPISVAPEGWYLDKKLNKCVKEVEICTDENATNYQEEGNCEYNEAGQCPTACGLEASEVSNGDGGWMQCDATAACEDSTPNQSKSDRRLSFNRLCNMEVELVFNYIDDNGNGVKDQEIKFYYKGEEKIAKTNESGRAGVTYGYKGEADVEARFDGDTRTTKVSDIQPSNCPATTTGQVLGATTMASTGLFTDSLVSIFGIAGSLLAAVGLRRYGKKN